MRSILRNVHRGQGDILPPFWVGEHKTLGNTSVYQKPFFLGFSVFRAARYRGVYSPVFGFRILLKFYVFFMQKPEKRLEKSLEGTANMGCVGNGEGVEQG